ncbi:hypothetical protein [Nocardioides aquiterrae]
MSILRAPVLVAVALAGALLVPASTSAQPARETTAGRTHVIADCVHRTVKPRKVIATCGDANVYAVVKRYGSWRAEEAWGSGRLHLNDCDPSCAEGTFHSYRATFRFHRVVDTRHGPLFTRLGATWLQGGEQQNAQYSLPRRRL